MRTITSALGAAAAIGAALVIAPPAANAAYGDCASGALCMYHNQSGSGTIIRYTSSVESMGSNSDEASSVYNRSSVAWILYDDSSFQDRRVCILSGDRVGDLGDIQFNDKISSVQKRGSNSCSGYTRVGS